MSVMEHLEEFRRRLMVVIINLVIGLIAGFYLSNEYVLDAILAVPGPENIIFIHPTEMFFTTLKVAFILALVISLPMIIYQIIAFLLPGLSSTEKKYVITGLPLSVFLFALGVFFAYSVILELAFDFFIGFGGDTVEPNVTVDNYISFALGLVIPFGLVFQLPLVVMILTGVGLVNPDFMRKNRKYIIFVIFIMAAFFTPPDMISQLFMAGPLLLLYEISVIISGIIYKRKIKNQVE